MQPLSLKNEADLNDTVCVSAIGTVSSIRNNPASFLMHVTQYITGGQSSDDIAIWADLHKNLKWSNPAEWLPQQKAIISIWGKLNCFNTYTFSGTKMMTSVVVDIEDITYLYNPKHDPANKPPFPQKKKSEI